VVCGEVNEIKHKGQTSLTDNKQRTSAARRRNLSFSASSCRAASTSFTNAFHFSCTDATISSYTQPTHRCTNAFHFSCTDATISSYTQPTHRCTSPQLTARAHTRTHTHTRTRTRTHTHTHTFNGPFSGTTRVSQYQKGKTYLNFTEARDSEWHASTPPLSFFTGRMPFLPPNQQCQST